MALLHCSISSDLLKMDTSLTVVLPQQPAPVPVLYLLHGAGDDSTAYQRFTSLERYVEPLGLAVVMPQVGRSFYTDQVHGQPYWSYLTEELPALVASMLRVSTEPADTFVAGLSMGGYGALKWALQQPGGFAAAASMSGALDIARVRQLRETHREPMMAAAFGQEELEGTDHDLFHLLAAGPGPHTLPLFVACGQGDSLIGDNTHFASVATDSGWPVTADFGPGEHEWPYWDATLQRLLSWLPIRHPSSQG